MCFNIDDIRCAEFFIQKENEEFYKVSIDNSVRDLLQSMLDNTFSEFHNIEIKQYSPSEKYNSQDKLRLELNSDYCQNILSIYNNLDIPVDNTQLLENTDKISYYFFRLTDNQNRTLLAIKKASFFKAITTQHAHIVRWFNNTLTTFSDNLFKLDKSFDIVVVNETVFINKYLVFEGIADLGETVRLASTENIRLIEQRAPLILFTEEAQNYIKSHIMAARLVASIKASGYLNNLSLDAVIAACNSQRINIRVENEQISFDSENTMNFLKLIDRRLFEINLTGEHELYEAPSRQVRNN